MKTNTVTWRQLPSGSTQIRYSNFINILQELIFEVFFMTSEKFSKYSRGFDNMYNDDIRLLTVFRRFPKILFLQPRWGVSFLFQSKSGLPTVWYFTRPLVPSFIIWHNLSGKKMKDSVGWCECSELSSNEKTSLIIC